MLYLTHNPRISADHTTWNKGKHRARGLCSKSGGICAIRIDYSFQTVFVMYRMAYKYPGAPS